MRHARIYALGVLFSLSLLTIGHSQVSVTYNSANGNLSAESSDRAITLFQMTSAARNLNPEHSAPGSFVLPFDSITRERLRKSAVDTGFYRINFGDIVKLGMSEEQFVDDMTFSGSLEANGTVNNSLNADGLDVIWINTPRPAVNVFYNTLDGNLSVESLGRSITTFEMISQGGNFTPAGATNGLFVPPWDVLTETKLFKFSAGESAFNTIDFGNVLQPGLTYSQLATDMLIDGSLTPGVDSGFNSLDSDGLNLIVVPEPGGLLLIGCGLFALHLKRRQTSSAG